MLQVDNIHLDRYTDDEIIQIHKELEDNNQIISLENHLFESYLARIHPQALTRVETEEIRFNGNHDTLTGNGNEVESNGGIKKDDNKIKKKRGEKAKQIDSMILLTPDQKNEIATRELEDFKNEFEKGKNDWAKMIDNVKAEIEEIDIRVAEIKKSMYEFKREIVQAGVSDRTGKVMAEKVVRYIEEKLRAKDSIIEKLRLKNSTLKTQQNKLHLQLRQKEEMGEVLHAIDFDQLKIENQQYLAQIEERNKELLTLKLTAGNVAQILNQHRSKMSILNAESENLRREIKARKELLSKLELESISVANDTKSLKSVNTVLKKMNEEWKVPNVMDYVGLKAKQQELMEQAKTWQRKCEISDKSLKR
ncbi:hypothetical protein BKA69DRAFT_1029830 [Paraphysoderma sedebokerense]|nr:hypothetical protein BKA69DRAFT_1029830 [Paraphysoderma sedebokerense]